VPILYLVIRRRWKSAVVCALVSPAPVLLAARCVDYAQGSGEYVRPLYSHVQRPEGNLNPVTRVRGFDPGCGTRPMNQWLRSWAKWQAVPIMQAIYGPPSGAYTGPYPTQAEAVRALAAAEPVRTGPWDGLRVGSRTFPGDVWELQHFGYVVNRADPSPMTASLYQGRCLIVRVPRDTRPPLATIHLLDAATGQSFAVYWEQADAAPSAAPAATAAP
jgi:hypothetical protein